MVSLLLLSHLLLASFVVVSIVEGGNGEWLTSSGNDRNTRTFVAESKCSINRQTVGDLKLAWKISLGGLVMGTPTLDGDGFLYVTSYANATSGSKGYIYKITEEGGSIVWKSPLDTCSGRSNSQSRNSPALSLKRGIAVIGDVKNGIIMGFRMDTGACAWSTIVDSHPLAGMTGSGSIEEDEGDIYYAGVSSQETAAAINPAYPCCTFVGSTVAVSVQSGVIIWQKYTIPAQYVGVGQHSGAAVHGSNPVFYGNKVCVGTGNTYYAPPEVVACEEERRLNTSLPSCVPAEIRFDALICYRKDNGAEVYYQRFDPYDAFNLGCICNYVTGCGPVGHAGPNCPEIPGTDSDFIQMPMIYGEGNNKKAAVGQKNGMFYLFDARPNGLVMTHARKYGPGGSIGGFLFGMSLSTNRHTGKHVAVGGIVNVERSLANVTLKDGSVYTSTGSYWLAISASGSDAGEVLWVFDEPAPPPQARGSVLTLNNVAFFGNTLGDLRAVDLKTGALLWNYRTSGTIVMSPSVGKRGRTIFVGTGYPTPTLGVESNQLYAFRLDREDCDEWFSSAEDYE